MLSAPRVDYLAESLARRKAREEKVAAQDLFRVPKVANEGSYQVAARAAEHPPRYAPTGSERTTPNPPTPRSTSNGTGHAALPPHMQSPSQQQLQYLPGGGAYGSPQGSVPSPYAGSGFSPGGNLLDGPTPPDFFQVGGGSFLGVYPDWNAAENDPSMVSRLGAVLVVCRVGAL